MSFEDLKMIEPAEGIHQIPLQRLHPDPFQPRTDFKQSAIDDLANSIALHGILTPLLVRPMQGPNSRGMFWIIAGERRLRAAQSLGIKTLPCRIRPCENTSAAVIALAENVHRQDLSELEKAEALLRIKTLTDRTWDQIAEVVRLSPDYVKRLVGLIKLEDPVKELLREGRISARVAIALKPLRPKQQIAMAKLAVDEGLTAEQIRVRSHALNAGRSSSGSKAPDLDVPGGLPRMDRAIREGTVVRALRNCCTTVEEIEDWLSQRRWSLQEVPSSQRAELLALSEKVTHLQSRLSHITNDLGGEIE